MEGRRDCLAVRGTAAARAQEPRYVLGRRKTDLFRNIAIFVDALVQVNLQGFYPYDNQKENPEHLFPDFVPRFLDIQGQVEFRDEGGTTEEKPGIVLRLLQLVLDSRHGIHTDMMEIRSLSGDFDVSEYRAAGTFF
eukprot:jgi/Bigna1/136101/aug1.32_g10809